MVGVNMSKHDEQAYVRGVKVAGFWKQLKRPLASWEQRSATWAKNHNVPVWVGRIPLVMAILISLTGLIAGGFVVALIVSFIWALAFILQNMGNSPNSNVYHYDNDSGPIVRSGGEGYGLYSGSDELTSYRMDRDIDD